jgi:putative nucleotidyltransferase with HDIG domain
MTDLSAAQSRASLDTDGEFMGIPVSSLRIDEMTEFDLYLPGNAYRQPVLYRSAELPFTEEARQRLTSTRVDQLLVKSTDRAAYKRYLERNLASIVSDTSIPLESRSATLYLSAQEVMHDLMVDPRSSDLVARSGNIVENTVRLLQNEQGSFRHLMQVTSYDYYTYTHSVNVFVFSTALMQRLGFDEATLQEFGQGALLHDVGKSQVDPAILNARGKLTGDEWEEMKRHTIYGCEILEAQGVTSPMILDITRHHHEKLRGGGYPDGLQGDEISQWARITTIADIFDALTTRRSYKDAMNTFPSLQLMREHMHEDLDPEFFRAFIDLMAHP